MREMKKDLIEILKQDERLWDSRKQVLNQKLLIDLLSVNDETLMLMFLNDNKIKDKFFKKINNIFIFKHNEFRFFLEENRIDNSYTQYLNRIGLYDGEKFINDRTETVLNFPYKDAILQGGQSSTEGLDYYYEYDEKINKNEEKKGYKPQSYNKKMAKRNEVFFNEILAADEIDRLFDKKALTNWKRHSSDGVSNADKIKRDSNGNIKENLIIRGNNLLGLNELKSNFSNKVKLIYIDPPYNTGNDEFKYNDRFSHSTWLTFMKNRLKQAQSLLEDDGVIFVQCDHHELGYLIVLMDEIFGRRNKVQIISCKTSSPAGFKTVNPGPIDVTEYILYYAKDKSAVNFKKSYTAVDYDSNYNLFIENIEQSPEEWNLVNLTKKYFELNDIDINEEKKKWGVHWPKIKDELIGEFALENADKIVSKRDPHKPTNTVKSLLEKSKGTYKVIEHKREGDSLYIYNGGSLAFYSNKIKEIDGKLSPSELLTDFWADISWAGIAKEGGVSLKNGKKPEKLLKRIIEMATEENDIVLDYHLGSGTTAAVAHKMNRQYIGIEQIDYGADDATIRLQNVINGDETGVSKIVDWNGGGSFLYFELGQWNEEAKLKIISAENIDELIELFSVLYEEYFLNYNFRVKEFKEKIIKEKEFLQLPLEEQKSMFLKMLDLNQLYIPMSEMEDSKYKLSEIDIDLTLQFNKED